MSAADVLLMARPPRWRAGCMLRPGAVLVLFERVPTTDTCCLWFEVVEGRIGGAGWCVSRGHKAATKMGGARESSRVG